MMISKKSNFLCLANFLRAYEAPGPLVTTLATPLFLDVPGYVDKHGKVAKSMAKVLFASEAKNQ